MKSAGRRLGRTSCQLTQRVKGLTVTLTSHMTCLSI